MIRSTKKTPSFREKLQSGPNLEYQWTWNIVRIWGFQSQGGTPKSSKSWMTTTLYRNNGDDWGCRILRTATVWIFLEAWYAILTHTLMALSLLSHWPLRRPSDEVRNRINLRTYKVGEKSRKQSVLLWSSGENVVYYLQTYYQLSTYNILCYMLFFRQDESTALGPGELSTTRFDQFQIVLGL